ncbi:amino acid adenylation domain-containing protein [Pseudomonas cuatrocienegasensis]|uniref:Amino acid adenylation domain-containing protein n=1 Tax=Pseudomonas cuatrocienegasensis TaxID=543360 RepID=A0ABY1BPI3_9PSED|nr:MULTISPECIES: AMP-binding protein [Pseudomonas]SER31371.1 amino acid adenylation domain-containing protein [Pseudomonas cuatrocienegasensis]
MDLGLPLAPAQKQLAEANPEAYRWARLQVPAVAAELLEQRLREAVQRHQALRLRYQRPLGATGLRQRLVEPGELHLDWRKANPADTMDADAWLREAQAHCRAQQPDVLAWLFDEQLLLAVPVYSLDSRSLEQLRSDLLGQGAALDAEPMQYSEYVEWISGLQLDEDAEQGAQFWRNLALHEVPGMRLIERYGMASGARACVQLALEPAVPAALQALASAEGVAVEQLALAAWGALLGRLNGQRHGQLGVQHDPRDDYEELQGAYGLFEQTLPMQLQLSEHTTWVSLARQLARQLENAIVWQEYLGQAQLLPEWRASYQAGLRVLRLHDLDALQALSFDGPVELQVQLSLDPRGRAQLALAYDAGLYRGEQMQLLLERYAHWLGQLLQAPQAPVDDISALLPAEAQPRPEPEGLAMDMDLVAAFRAHARSQPNRPALRDGELLLSYAELDALSDRVAGSLRQAGIGSEQLVALYLPRGAQMLIAMLACFKAGAAYLPLDPAQPPLRLAGILEDAQPAMLLHLDGQGAGSDIAAMPWSVASSGPAFSTPLACESQHLAYVLYTSGTSGKPKGVQIEQGQLRHYVTQVTRALDLPEGGHYGLVSSLLADLGNTVLYPAWLQGGCVHLLSQASVTDAQAFAEELREYPLDVLKIVPSHLEALIGEHPAHAVLPRQVLVLGGEPVGENLLARLAQAAPSCRLYNHYGPTETTVGVLWRAIDIAAGVSGTALNQVIGDNRIHLLDERQRPVPSGQPGELCIAGASVGRGYVGGVGGGAFGRDTQSGARLYRSGDQALRQADGALRILGRNDQQVKIRGFRLELVEVEQALLGQPGVLQAAVLLDGERLLAFVVEDEGQAQAVQQLRDDLARQLPDYMLPAAIFAVKSLPLNSNGKLDRQVLLERARQRLQSARVAPVGALESVVLDIWCRVLGVEDLGVTDNFFAVGGHSLAAIKVVALIREQLAVNPPTNLLFERQTVRELVRSLDQAESGGGWKVLHEPATPAPTVVLLHGAQGHLQAYRPLLEQLGDACAVYGLAAFDDGWTGGDFDGLLARYVQSIPADFKQRPLTLLGWSLAARLALLLIPHLQAAGFSVNALAVVDHDPQRSLAGEGDEGGQLLADFVFHCRSHGRPLGEALRERLAGQLTACDYAEGVTRLLADAAVREHLQWDSADAGLQALVARYRAIKTCLYEQVLPVVDVPIWLWRGNAHGDLRGQWQAHTRKALRELSLDVGHHAILAEPRLSAGLLSLLTESASLQNPAEMVSNS